MDDEGVQVVPGPNDEMTDCYTVTGWSHNQEHLETVKMEKVENRHFTVFVVTTLTVAATVYASIGNCTINQDHIGEEPLHCNTVRKLGLFLFG